MVREHTAVPGNVRALASAQSQLAATLLAASQEIAHSECLDVEDRAEVYTILEAILADTQVHRETIELLAHNLTEGGIDA